ncbi:MAG TPA: type II toxin-antitoxin system YafQ family toxin [Rhabdochlamydiaceae bacterium]
MLELSYIHQFKKDLKLVDKRGRKLAKLNEIVSLLCAEKSLPVKNRNHKLGGNYADHWECHIEPDWLLIYLKTSNNLTLIRTGSHADLF